MENKKTIVFAAATYNLSETQRMAQIAGELKKTGRFDVIFAHYTPEEEAFSFVDIVKDEGVEPVLLEPHMTRELSEYILEMDRGQKVGDFIPAAILEKRVENEVALLKSHDVACVVTGFCLSFYVSCRLLDIPVVSVLSGSMFWWLEQDPHHFRIPDLLPRILGKMVPKKWLFSLFKWVMFNVSIGVKGMNKILKRNQKKPFSGPIDMLMGDIYFASDIPEYIPLREIPDNFYYTGALIGRMNTELPAKVFEAQQYAREKKWPLVYFSMGSSGRPPFIKKCLEILSGHEIVVISPMKKILEKDKRTRDYRPAENIFLCGWLPADKVNKMCDVALIHGGQGTVNMAIISRTPFCAIGNGNSEQEFNVEASVHHGFARLYRRQTVKPEQLIGGLMELLHDPEAKAKIGNMAELFLRPEWNGEKRAADTLIELFDSRVTEPRSDNGVTPVTT
jgi:uncharacterized protein YjgD (DUF1641 family)